MRPEASTSDIAKSGCFNASTSGPGVYGHADGHEKLAHWFLPIYGIRDRFSGAIAYMKVKPNIRRKNVALLIYLEHIEEMGGSW